MLGKPRYPGGGTIPARGSIGNNLSNPVSCSNKAAAPNATASPRVGAAICNPTGRPNRSNPAGTATAAALANVIAAFNIEAPM